MTTANWSATDMRNPILPENPSLELCCEVNYDLWVLFCRWRRRPLLPSHVWTELDVVNAFRYLEPLK
jgi:hypothetical protein